MESKLKGKDADTQTDHAHEFTRLPLNDTAMYMAMLMEMHPLACKPVRPTSKSDVDEPFNKVGVIVIDAGGLLFASDYSKEYCHAVVSLILKYRRRLDGSTLYVSRKPCSDCVKHMIQETV
ncbi:uncharacterized protein LOC144445438 [Glandiceps talaboti]